MSSEDELTRFFNWRPASLYPSPTASQSKRTRDPSFYDKLLGENFILRRVRNLPSLPKDIAGTVDNVLNSISERGIELPPYSKKFPTESGRSFVLQTRPSAMKSELSVAEFYAHTTAVFCVNVASVLALLPMLPGLPDWLNVLCWTVTPSKSGYAIADGSLQIIPMDSPKSEAEKLLCESPLWPHLQKVSKTLGVLAIWEFESLSVGDHSTMLGIRNEAFTGIPFRWETMNAKPFVVGTTPSPRLAPTLKQRPGHCHCQIRTLTITLTLFASKDMDKVHFSHCRANRPRKLKLSNVLSHPFGSHRHLCHQFHRLTTTLKPLSKDTDNLFSRRREGRPRQHR